MRVAVFRIVAPDQATSVVVPDLLRATFEKNITIRNIDTGLGQSSLRFNFDGDFGSHYSTLAPGETSRVISGLRGGDVIYLDGIGGSATLEVMVWEE